MNGSVLVTQALVFAQHLKQQKNSKKHNIAPRIMANNAAPKQSINAAKPEIISKIEATMPITQPQVRGSLKLMSLQLNWAFAWFTAALVAALPTSSENVPDIVK